MRRVLPVLLLVALPAWAEDVRPNGTSTSSANSCSTATAHTTTDDDPNTPGGDWCTDSTCGDNAAATWLMQFATPTGGSPTSGADEQAFAVYVRKCRSASGNPTCTLNVYCNGSLITTGGSQSITSTTGQLLTQAFTFSGSCASDGSDMEIQVACAGSGGSPSARNEVDLDAAEWRASVAVPSARRVFIVD